MDINLFSGGPFVLLSAANAVVVYYLLQKLLRVRSLRLTIPFVAVISIVVAGLMLWAVKVAFPADKMPPNLLFMALPFSVCVSLVGLSIWARKLRLGTIAAANILLGLLVSLLLVNSYYHYYPTVGSLFGKVAKNPTTTVVYPAKPVSPRPLSVEAQLFSSTTSSADGTLGTINIPGTVSKFKTQDGYVYVPAINSVTPKVQLPVIVLMSGVPGHPYDWLNGGQLVASMNEFAGRHHGVTPYVFVVDNLGTPNNDTECVNSPRGNVDTYLSVDVPNYIKKHFDVSTDPSQWAIGGLSMGGLCGLMVTTRHPDTYHYFLDFGGETSPEVGSKQKTLTTLFGGSEAAWQQYQPEWLLSQRKYAGMGGFFAVGRSDKASIVTGITKLHKDAQDAGMETVLQLVGGQHTFNVWNQSYRYALPWISNRLGATDCTTNACY